MAGSYLPSKDADLVNWAVNFSAYVTAHTVAIGLIAGQATALAAVTTAFQTAYNVITVPATTTAVTVEAKNVAKAALVTEIRQLVAIIRATPANTDAIMIAMGLPVYDLTKTEVPAPSTQPQLGIVAAYPLQHVLRFADSASPNSRAKPTGSIGLQLFCSVGVAPATVPDTSKFKTFATKQPFTVDFDAADLGKTATYYARWQTATGKLGPWSQALSFTVAG